MQIVWISVAVIGAAILELGIGSYGFAVPVMAAALFHLSLVFGWRAVVFQGLLAGAAVDFFVGRHVPATPLLILPGVMLLAGLWRSEGNPRLLPLQAVPGAACGLFQAAVLLPIESFNQEPFFWGLLLHNLWIAGQYAAGGALVTPLFCHLFDILGHKLGFPPYLAAPTPETPHAP